MQSPYLLWYFGFMAKHRRNDLQSVGALDLIYFLPGSNWIRPSVARRANMNTNGKDAADDPLRCVDWRACRARRLADTGRRPSPHDDFVTVALARLYTNRRNVDAENCDRDLACAVAISEDRSGLKAALLQARLLGRQAVTQIAANLGITVRAVAWYSLGFFDVSDRLANRDFVLGTVIGIGPDENEKDGIIAWVWRRAAYLGGIGDLEKLLAHHAIAGRPLSSRLAQASRDIFRHIMSAASAVADPRDARVVGQLLRWDSGLMSEVGAGDTQHTQLMRHIEAMLVELPFTFGTCDPSPKNPLIGAYDEAGIELSADELLKVGNGQAPETLPALDLKLPEPRHSKNLAPKTAPKAECEAPQGAPRQLYAKPPMKR
jgi:hypothetical protein